MTGPLLIIGAGGHGHVVGDIAEVCGWGPIAFLDGDPAADDPRCPWRVIGAPEAVGNYRDAYPNAFVAIGDNARRLEVLDQLAGLGFELPALVHPKATISRHATIAEAGVVMAGVVVNFGASVARGAILNTGCMVDHDCRFGEGVHVSPGAAVAGGVSIGVRSWIGIGASVCQCVAIGSDVMVGAGAAVVSDIGDGLTVGGVPARRLGNGS